MLRLLWTQPGNGSSHCATQHTAGEVLTVAQVQNVPPAVNTVGQQLRSLCNTAHSWRSAYSTGTKCPTCCEYSRATAPLIVQHSTQLEKCLQQHKYKMSHLLWIQHSRSAYNSTSTKCPTCCEYNTAEVHTVTQVQNVPPAVNTTQQKCLQQHKYKMSHLLWIQHSRSAYSNTSTKCPTCCEYNTAEVLTAAQVQNVLPAVNTTRPWVQHSTQMEKHLHSLGWLAFGLFFGLQLFRHGRHFLQHLAILVDPDLCQCQVGQPALGLLQCQQLLLVSKEEHS